MMKSTRKTCKVLALFLGLLLPMAAASAADQNHHCLWKIPGRTNAVYLLGSVHFLKESDYPLPPVIENAFSNSTVAVFETDMGKLQDLDTQTRLMKNAQLPEGQTLSQVLTTNTYAAFRRRLQDMGLGTALFDHLKPALGAMTLEVFAMQKMGLDPSYGLDLHFFQLAKKAGKQLVPLETVDFQIDLVTGFTPEEGELIMKTTLEDIDTTEKLLGELLQAWRTGDSEALQKLLNHAMADAPAIFKRLVTDRNHSWLPKIEEWSRSDQSVIVIVGAGHLVGPDGLVALLQKAGLKAIQQ
jgi:uncharacterized protein YbaP (TraB family)